MLAELFTGSQVPQSHCVIQTSCPQLVAIRRYVNTASTISVPLELAANREKRNRQAKTHKSRSNRCVNNCESLIEKVPLR